MRHRNAPLVAATLPALRRVARYGQARIVDVGDYFYGVNNKQGEPFRAWLGTSTAAEPVASPYFPASWRHARSQGRHVVHAALPGHAYERRPAAPAGFYAGSPRYRRVAANAQYLVVDAEQGGQPDLTVAGARYRVPIEPPAQGQLRVELLD